MLFMGEEWGATAPFLFFTDHNAELAPLVRDGRRKEFAKFAAFQDPAKRERIPDPNAEAPSAPRIPDPAEAERAPHDAILALHRRLLALRHAAHHPAPAGRRGARRPGDRRRRRCWPAGGSATAAS